LLDEEHPVAKDIRNAHTTIPDITSFPIFTGGLLVLSDGLLNQYYKYCFESIYNGLFCQINADANGLFAQMGAGGGDSIAVIDETFCTK
jgi:hypothetical protein